MFAMRKSFFGTLLVAGAALLYSCSGSKNETQKAMDELFGQSSGDYYLGRTDAGSNGKFSIDETLENVYSVLNGDTSWRAIDSTNIGQSDYGDVVMFYFEGGDSLKIASNAHGNGPFASYFAAMGRVDTTDSGFINANCLRLSSRNDSLPDSLYGFTFTSPDGQENLALISRVTATNWPRYSNHKMTIHGVGEPNDVLLGFFSWDNVSAAKFSDSGAAGIVAPFVGKGRKDSYLLFFDPYSK